MIPLDINNLIHKKDITILDKGIADATDELEKLYAVFAKAEFLNRGGVDFLPDRKQAFELYEAIYQNEKSPNELKLLAQFGQAHCLSHGSNNFTIDAKRAYDIFNGMDNDQVETEIRQKAIYGKASSLLSSDINLLVNINEAIRLLESLDHDKVPIELTVKVIILKVRCILLQLEGSGLMISSAAQNRLEILIGRLDLNNKLISIGPRQSALKTIADCNVALHKYELALAQYDKLDNDLTLMSIRQFAILGKARCLFTTLRTAQAFALFESLDNDQTDNVPRRRSVLFMATELTKGFFVRPDKPKALVYFKRLLTLASLPQYIQTICNQYIPLLERDIQQNEVAEQFLEIDQLQKDGNIAELDKIIKTAKNAEIILSATRAKAECLRIGGKDFSPNYIQALELYEMLDDDLTPEYIRNLSIIGKANCLHSGRSHFHQGTDRAIQLYDRLLNTENLPAIIKDQCITQKMAVLECQNRELKNAVTQYQRAAQQARPDPLPPFTAIMQAAQIPMISTANSTSEAIPSQVISNANNSTEVKPVVSASTSPLPVMCATHSSEPQALPTLNSSGTKRKDCESELPSTLQGTPETSGGLKHLMLTPNLFVFSTASSGANRRTGDGTQQVPANANNVNSSICIPR